MLFLLLQAAIVAFPLELKAYAFALALPLRDCSYLRCARFTASRPAGVL